MQITGELTDNKIIVKKPKDVGRLYSKSHIGIPLAGNKLELNLLEGAFLLGEEKIRIFRNKSEINFQELVKLASKNITDFEIKYLVFRDLRNRGHSIGLCEEKNITFAQVKDGKKQFLVSAISERDNLDLDATIDLTKNVEKQGKELWIGIVDEEGDITYYVVSLIDPEGKNKEHIFRKTSGVLLKDRVAVFDKNASKELLEKEFYGKPFGDGLQLSLVETIYLIEKGFIDVETSEGEKIFKEKFEKIVLNLQPDIKSRLEVFRDLKKRGLIVKTGFKFGTNFRAYTTKPDDTHAEYLIHALDRDFKGTWAEISRAVRLAHSVNKEIAFATTDKGKIEYIKFGRLRP